MKHPSVSTWWAVVFITLLSGVLVAKLRATSTSEELSLYQSPAYEMQLPADIIEEVYFPDENQGLAVFRNADSTLEFQVFTMPVNGPLPLTADELKEGLPELVINDFENTAIDRQDAISFYSQDPDIGDTFEVWFVDDGLLYQVTTYARLETWLANMLTTWRFR